MLRLLRIALVAGMLVVAGCGDDDDDGTATTAGASGASGAAGVQSADEWVAQADAICKEADSEGRAATEQFLSDTGLQPGESPTDADLEELVDQITVPNIQGQIDDIRALAPPEGQEEQAQEFLDQAQSDLDEVEADPSLITGSPFDQTTKLAEDLGLRSCAQ
jgi:hypothetical protein